MLKSSAYGTNLPASAIGASTAARVMAVEKRVIMSPARKRGRHSDVAIRATPRHYYGGVSRASGERAKAERT
jgi:hypothetical protein